MSNQYTHSGSPLDRVLARSEPDGDCVVWTGLKTRDGYGRISIGGTYLYVHRVAWIGRHGEPPEATPFVLHHCDNPPCIRDEHLFLGTLADNNADRDAKGRQWSMSKTHCPKGHPYDEANTYVAPHNGIRANRRDDRGCRICRTEAVRRSAARRRLAAAS